MGANSHQIRQGDTANPSAEQLKTVSDPSPQSGEGVTEKDLQPDYGPGGKEASEAKNKTQKK